VALACVLFVPSFLPSLCLDWSRLRSSFVVRRSSFVVVSSFVVRSSSFVCSISFVRSCVRACVRSLARSFVGSVRFVWRRFLLPLVVGGNCGGEETSGSVIVSVNDEKKLFDLPTDDDACREVAASDTARGWSNTTVGNVTQQQTTATRLNCH